jgi:hypothetical protein
MNVQEIILRKTIPVVINSFNQLYYLKNIIMKLKDNNFGNIIILDNLSTYDPLLNFYQEVTKNNQALVIYYNANRGPRYFHQSGLYKILGNIPHLYTDPDIDFDKLDEAYLTTLIDVSNKYKIFKVGSALEIPDSSEMKPGLFMKPGDSNSEIPIVEWESQFWKNEFEPSIYNSPIDTTFHLFNPMYYSDNTPYLIGARIAKNNFIVKHLPWYNKNSIPNDEYLFYKSTGSAYNNY